MTQSAPRPCGYPGCAELVQGGSRCDRHRKQERQRSDQERGSAATRLYDYRWQKARSAYLRLHPLCECDECRQLRRVMAATVVDHRVPHRGDEALFWDRDNWQAMSKACHDRKTATEDGGFGNRAAQRDTIGL